MHPIFKAFFPGSAFPKLRNSTGGPGGAVVFCVTDVVLVTGITGGGLGFRVPGPWGNSGSSGSGGGISSGSSGERGGGGLKTDAEGGGGLCLPLGMVPFRRSVRVVVTTVVVVTLVTTVLMVST